MPSVYILNLIVPFVIIICLVKYIHLTAEYGGLAPKSVRYDYYALAIGSLMVFLLTIYSARVILSDLSKLGFILCPLAAVILGLVLGTIAGHFIYNALKTKSNVIFSMYLIGIIGIIYATGKLQWIFPMIVSHL